MHKLKFRHKHVLLNEVTVFARTKQDKIALSEVVSEFSSVWQNIDEIIDVTEKNMIHISLMNDWQKIKLLIKIYSLSFKNKQMIDKTFNKLHDQECMQWFNQVTLFKFSVFVIKKNRKFRVMIDIRELNKITVFDAYSLSQQKNIIAAIHRVRYISMIDVTVFFHQWLVHSQNQSKLAVNTHCSQEFFKVAVMKFHNSLSYVQCQADRLFKNLSKIKVYIDDIVIRSETLEQHVVHLRRLFQCLIEKRISLKSIKAFIDFLNVTLLDNVINVFELFMTQNKIKIIKKLKFSVTVKQLEHYVSLTEYFRSKISHFVQIVKLLQKCKTELLKQSSLKDLKQWNYTAKFTFITTQNESEVFLTLQTILTEFNFLIHHDLKRQLYVDLNVSKEKFDVITYHINVIMKDSLKSSNQNSVQSILFLSKLLTQTEKNYWSTEMKMICMIWIMHKLHHMLKDCQSSLIIYIDHVFIVKIVNQTYLKLLIMNKLNLWLIRASQYLLQFFLEIRHCTDKFNVIFDTLSRLSRMQLSASQKEIRDETFAHNVTVTSMFISLKRKIICEYRDSHWQKILTVMKQLSAEEKMSHFFQENELLYFKDFSKQSWLYLSQSMKHWIFAQIHNDKAHQKFH